MFRIERKTVHVGTEKIVTLYWQQVYAESEGFSFTFIDAEEYAASEKWEKIFIFMLSTARFICESVAQR